MEPVLTPMMKQFRDIKTQYPDAILLFRCGDFYETYAEDAQRASKLLGITLTHRSNGAISTTPIDMAGFPFHALDTYLPKLVRAGLRVAICDQLEDPKLTKKLVRRGVTELVTPGVSYSDTTLSQKSNTFLAAVVPGKGTIGLSLLDISTGEFLVAEDAPEAIDKLLSSFAPAELLYPRNQKDALASHLSPLTSHPLSLPTHALEDWMLTPSSAHDRLTKQFGTASLKGFGLDSLPNGVIAAGAILYYLDQTQHLYTDHIRHLSRIEQDRYVWMDRFTVRNLELMDSTSSEGVSLLSVLDRTLTPMGGRLLRRWVSFPLKKVREIQNRQSVVEYLFRNPEAQQTLSHYLNQIQDLERLVGKIATGRISPRELLQLACALEAIAPIQQMALQAPENSYLHLLGEQLHPCPEASERIRHDIVPDPPAQQGKPGIFASGVDAELDELRRMQTSGKDYLLALQQREIEATGIASLKIGYNNVFGYYLEVRNTYRDQVPDTWIRKQTLVNAERYITEELKEYEEKILNAETNIAIIETRLYGELLAFLNAPLSTGEGSGVRLFQQDAAVIAQLDCLQSFAAIAQSHHYCCPQVDDSLVVDIHQGRHPVIEQQLPPGTPYIPNDVLLDNNSQQIIILTGPNMAGKSALLRQTALIVLLAQIGSFVPADSATIGVVDKIFTRVGASDNISMGESTFMVEMNEAASILNNLSSRSLVLFDELGRGTSTYDGISIAWAIVEYIHEHPGHAKTLFATHYHELNEMEESLARIRNYNVSVREANGKVLFMRTLQRGGSEHSFGIHVAKLAGMPPSIVQRAGEVLKELESSASHAEAGQKAGVNREGYQLSFFKLDDPVLEQIRDQIHHLDLNSLTPLEALNKLAEIQRIIGGKH